MPQGIYSTETNDTTRSTHEVQGYPMPVHNFIFVIVEEPGTDGYLTRIIYTDIDNAHFIKKIPNIMDRIKALHPEEYGVRPIDPNSKVTVARHVLGDTKSKYISTSRIFPEGTPRFDGKRIYIDIAKLKSSGAKIITTSDILSALDEYALKHPASKENITRVKEEWVKVDKEVLIDKAKIPARYIYTAKSLKLVYKMVEYGRVVQIFSIYFTAYDLSNASVESIKRGNVKPIAAETVRQLGGWGAAMAGFKIGAASGAFFGLGTGPGALATGFIGGIVGGVVGYLGADSIADLIDEN